MNYDIALHLKFSAYTEFELKNFYPQQTLKEKKSFDEVLNEEYIICFPLVA